MYDSDRNYEIQNTYKHLEAFLKVKDQCNNEVKGQVPDVVGTTHYVNSDGTLPFNGGNSAYLRQAYLDNPFDTSIREAKWIWQEEEIDWRNKLAKCGSVISVEANYSDIDPIPLMSCAKRILNLKNSFGGGENRSNMNENLNQVILKIIVTLTLTIFISFMM